MALLLDLEYIIVIVLGGILILLLLVFLIAMLIFMKKRRIMCFSRDAAAKPFMITDKQLEAGWSGGRKQKSRPFFQAKPSRAKPKGGKRGRRGKAGGRYTPLRRSPAAPKKDPFAKGFLENPMVDDEELDVDWTNPAFDEERAQLYDAAISIQCWYRMVRVRVPYLELREGTILCQALFRGRRVRRMLPQLRKEKQLRDHQRRKHAGWKKKGTLAALKFYDVKGYGFAEVEQLYGLETIRNAAYQLKALYGGKGKMRLKLFISVKGLKLFDYYSLNHFATVKVSSVSFCTLDPKNKKIFAFINRKKKRNFCHVFQASEQDAQKMVETIAEAFEVTFKKLEEKKERREMTRVSRLARLQKETFHRQSKDLEVEVTSMMEMAETASLTGGHSRPMLHIAELDSEGGSPPGSTSPLSGSMERLPPGRSRSSTAGESSLLMSQASVPPPPQQERRKEEPQEEPFDPTKLDAYFSDIKRGMEDIAQKLETDSKRASMEAERKRASSIHRTGD